MSRIFISHSSVNDGPAIALRDWLVAGGWDDLFLDLDPQRGLTPGERWERALHDAVYRCEAVLFLVSRAWIASDWCRKEFHLARKKDKPMFVILIEDLAIADLPAELTATWQLVDLAQGADHQAFRASLPNGREEQVTFSKAALQQLKTGLRKAGLDPRFFAWPPADDPGRPPYRGLLPLEAEDAGIFFGREAPIIETLDRLRGLREEAPPRLLVILGASGAGKSSFLRAGLIPRLARDDRHFLVLPVIRPERAVISGEAGLLRSLEEACQARGLRQARADIRGRIAEGASAVAGLLQDIARAATPPSLGPGTTPTTPSLVLAIDQGEELFQAEGGEESGTFQALLADLLKTRELTLIVLFTIRSDAYERLQTEPPLGAISQRTLSLPPMPKGAYQTVIEGPALRLTDPERALKIEPQLTAALLEDLETGATKDALPLLAFTLERLYLEHGGKGRLDFKNYADMGRIAGAIEAAVERAMAAADADPAVPKDRPARLALMRRAFIPWLAGIDPDTGSPRRSIARFSDIPEEARPLVRHLIDQRLLATDRSVTGEQTIEPAHEALLRQWGTLKGWLDEDFAELAALEGVKRATRDWLANDKSPDWLAHAAGRLEDAEGLKARPDLAAKMAADDLDYLAQCRAAEVSRKDRELSQARKLARTIAMGLAAAVLLAIIAAGFGYYGVQKANEAGREKQRALYNEVVALSGLSRVALAEGHPIQAVKLSLAAWPRTGEEGRPALRRTAESLNSSLPQNHQRLLLKGHGDSVFSATFSPDGTRVVTASGDSTARLWDAKSGAEIAVLKGHESTFCSAAFSPDGTRVLTASRDSTARLWDAKTGFEITVLDGFGAVCSAAFSPDGTHVVTAYGDSTAHLWDAKTGVEIAVFKGSGTVYSADFSPDGTRVVTASDDNTARLWDAKTGDEIAVFKGHVNLISYAFSFDGTRVVTASDKTARLWDTKTGAEIGVLKGHENTVYSVAFSPDGTRVVTASADNTARLWQVKTRGEIAVLKGHESYVSSAVFSPDGTRVVTGSYDDTARLWDAKTGIEIAVLKGHEGPVYSAAFSPDGTRVVTASGDKTARLWDAKSGAALAVLKGHENALESAVFSPDGTRVVTASSDDTARLWDAKSGAEIAILKGHESSVYSADFSPDGTRVVTASVDKTARLWDAKTGAEIAVLKGHRDVVASATFSPDGTRVVTGSFDTTARLWDAKRGTEITVFEGSENAVSYAVFSPDGTRVATVSTGLSARLWNTKTGAEIAVLTGNESEFAVFSPDGMRVVMASGDNTARLWDAKTGADIAVLRGHESTVNSAAFSPDGTRVVTSSNDNTARLWDISDFEKGDAFSIACQRLGNDTDLADVRWHYGLGEMVPICGANAPLPVDLTKLQ